MSIDKIFAIIVTYNPEIENVKKLATSLKTQNVVPVIVDNGTLKEADRLFLEELLNVISLKENEGIAKAQNVGIQYAKDQGADFVLFFDQDSEISSDFVSSLINDFNLVKASDPTIGMIGPTFIDSRYKFYYKQILLNRFGIRKKVSPEEYDSPFKATLIISSGSLVPVIVLDSVGYMDERFFIDYVDTEWCLRALAKGYSIYVSTSAIMEHAIGDKMISFLGLHIPVHSPIRRYYRIRNAILFSKYKHVPRMLVLRDNMMNIIHQTMLVFNEKNKLKNIKIAFKAIGDGIKGKTGKL
ncbi:TPA: glycosyltransferase family 2 protein [Raoultella planticola]